MDSDDQRAMATETHVSYVFFTAERAFKIKKAVRFPYLDFTSVADRQRACEREVALNRRLAPDVYECAATIVDEAGTAIDAMVVMNRMPSTRRLSRLAVEDARDLPTEIERIALVLAEFHAGATRSSSMDAVATPAQQLRLWLANTDELLDFVPLVDPERVRRIAELAGNYLAGRQPLFDERIAESRVVDGHGDLLADDIFCLEDGPRLLDCVEFDDELRYGDGLADAAFLAMDLERLGRADLGDLFLRAYAAAANDHWPDSLADYYVAARAQIRAKVACARGDWEGARTLLELAEDHLDRATVRLVVVGGGPGTGKSTLAAGVARRRGWMMLRSDAIRKQLGGVPPGAHCDAPYGTGIYSSQMTECTYAEMLRRARLALAMGESVVLDATWPSDSLRRRARTTARATAARLTELCCAVPLEVGAERLRRRAVAATDISDATVAIARAWADASESWPEAQIIDTSTGPSAAVDLALEAIDRSRRTAVTA